MHSLMSRRWVSHFLVLSVWFLLATSSMGCYTGPISSIQVRLSQTLMAADGKSKSELRVIALNADNKPIEELKEDIKLLLDGKPFEGKEFKTETPGKYRFQAMWKGFNSPIVELEAKTAKDYTFTLMKQNYLWYKDTPNTPSSELESPESVVNTLAHRPDKGGKDRWTHIADRVEYDNFYQGKYFGIGVRINYDAERKLRIRLVYEGTPAYKAGLRRGMIVHKINDKTIKEIEDEKLWDTIFGENKEGVKVKFDLQKGEEDIKTYTVPKTEVSLPSVYTSKIHSVQDRKVGYIYFDRFIDPSNKELDKQFENLKKEKIDDLILDLRYNGGGLLRVAIHLASLVLGKQGKDKTFYRYAHNDKFKHWDNDAKFEDLPQSLNLNRLFVITSGGTASASEVVINGLRAFIPVILVGNKTYGKPVGAYSYNFFNKVMSLISFRVVNNKGEGDFFDGMSVDIEVNDDITQELGDANEACLKAALKLVGSKSMPLLPKPILGRPVQRLKRIPWKGFQAILQAY